MTRIALIADIHHGAPSVTKRGDTALALMEDFARWSNAEAPDLVLDLGDRISDIDRETDLRLAREVADAFGAVAAPIHHICGNHDRDHMTVAENEEILGQRLANEIIDLGDWQLALWRADAKVEKSEQYRGFVLVETDLIWLSRALQNATKPVLIASHVPVSGHSQIGNYYFERAPEFSRYPGAERVRAAIAQCAQPVAMISGHVHWNTVTTIDGTPHMTQQSLTESFTTQGEPARAWGMLELAPDASLAWEVFGDDPFAARLRPSARPWTPPLAPLGNPKGMRLK